ncbi:Ptx1 protein [Operophtera brumata]|uniref:Endoplasmic reticulum-Golgi intermediate compartment protein 3 n=1 Tax=Operophtera brumata TaxID=104452 RepID=A0A0L7LNU7_OPEBR|nr:Ptx1 protein [Operophtera brumata]
MSSQFIDKFKQFDAYAKPLEDFRIKTTTGAAISVVSGIVALLLFFSEIQTYLSPNVSEELFVDTSRGPKLRINLDIIVKQNNTDVATVTCGSCYGAALNESKIRRWALPDLATIEQCKNDESIERTNLALKEGCQIYGYMEVNRVGGSFHIAPGKSFTVNHIHVHDVQPYSSSVFNTTHIIKHLSFGSAVGSVSTAPLNGITGVAKEGAVMFQYYLKIIPTLYVNLNNNLVHTNQFSVTRHQKSVNNVNAESGMPGVFFSYELSPLMVKYTEKERQIH